MSDSAKKPTPPYLPFSTVKGFVEILHNTTLPTLIDKSLMRHLSGGVQSHLMVALRFLGLIGPKGETTERLERLHAAFGTPDKWQSELKTVITAAYAPIIGNHDVTKLTDKQLDDAFRAGAELDGVMLDRATRFYIQALTDAKAPISPHLLNRKRKPSGKRSATKSTKNGGAVGPGAEQPPAGSKPPGAAVDPPPPGSIEYPIHFAGGKAPGRLIVPMGLTAEDVNMIELLIPMLRAYAKPVASNAS